MIHTGLYGVVLPVCCAGVQVYFDLQKGFLRSKTGGMGSQSRFPFRPGYVGKGYIVLHSPHVVPFLITRQIVSYLLGII